jgi:FMN phosphatase YigB (HAD superfamily)
MELKLNERLGSDYDSLSGIRNRVFSDFSVDSLVISDQVVETLSVLRPHYVLVLVTEGIERIQKGKIRHLGIGSAFEDMIFLDPGEARAKEAAIAVFLAGQGIEAREAVIVGNRLDREIAAGRRLGITTIWIRKGEGSEMVPGKENEPDFTIRDFAELPAALMAISGRG